MDVPPAPCDSDTIGVIELELLKLVRHLETFGRRSSLYREVDRAGYLVLRTLETTGPMSTTSLATTLNLDASTVTRQITATIILTEEGHRTMAGVERERRHGMEALVGDWAEHDKVTLGRALSRLNISLLESGRTSKDVG
jgi:transcriptional antiterminator